MTEVQRIADQMQRAFRRDAWCGLLLTEQSPERGGGVSCYITWHGMAQHDLYHAGQISMLKKSCVK